MRLTKIFAAGTIFAAFAAVTTTAVAQPTVKLRLGHVTTAVSIAGQGAQAFAKAAKEISNGQVEIEVFPNSQLGGELEMLSQVRLGTLDIAMNGSGIVAAIEPSFSITELPFIWKNRETAWATLVGPIGLGLLSSLEPKGIKGLSWGVWDFRGFLMNGTVIETPADMKGEKIRIIENPLYVRTLQALGASPVPMAWPEVYTGLQQGTIDGVETNYHGMADAKLYEVAKNLAATDHIFTATVYLMNLDKFNSLSPTHQDFVLQAARVAGETMRAGAAKANQDAIAVMKENGVKVTRPNREPFIKATEPVIKYFSTIVGPELVQQVIDSQR